MIERPLGDTWLRVTTVPELSPSGAPERFLEVVEDITERRRAEEQLRQAYEDLARMTDRLRREQASIVRTAKLSSLGVLAAGVAHEINNPLSGMRSCARSLRQGSVPEDRQELYWDALEDGFQRIQAVVGSLLDYSRSGSSGVGTFPIGEAVEQCLTLLSARARARQVTIGNQVDPALEARADRRQIVQALFNILLNAVDASPQGGTVSITTEADGPGPVAISVSDEGPGIPASLADKVLEPFFTTKPEGEGTGLGLSVSLGLVHSNHGDLDLSDAPGGGTRVTIRLPAG